jgi:putative tryptophan/tyrosine transport system substrate-binding protein
MVADPVSSGFVTSLSRPGGHVTGFATLEGSPGGKWLGLLKEIGPRVARVAMLIDPATAAFAEIYLNPFKAAAASLGQEAIAAPVHDTSELESVVAAQAREPNSGLIVVPDAFTAVPSRRGRSAGGSLPSPSRLSVPSVYRTRRAGVLRI